MDDRIMFIFGLLSGILITVFIIANYVQWMDEKFNAELKKINPNKTSIADFDKQLETAFKID